MKLSEVVPWGRSLSEYKAMFSLSGNDLGKKVLGCADGPASFNAELFASGGDIISTDPIYQFNSNQIRLRIDEVYPQVIDQVIKNRSDFIWKNIASVEQLGNIRLEAMKTFLTDYDDGRKSGRYINASLPSLPFGDDAFELALCSHYLFLYSEHVDQEQHISSMRELCRVATEVRVYPLITIGDNRISPHLDPVISDLNDRGIIVDLVPVDYEFQKGATEMLVARCR